jgi:hypothetical protein
MVYRKRRFANSVPSGFYRFETTFRRSIYGFGDGEFIRLRDEFGNVWRGLAERQDDNTIRYHFHDSKGKTVSGISDQFGIILRDHTGHVWRGFLD